MISFRRGRPMVKYELKKPEQKFWCNITTCFNRAYRQKIVELHGKQEIVMLCEEHKDTEIFS